MEAVGVQKMSLEVYCGNHHNPRCLKPEADELPSDVVAIEGARKQAKD